MVIIMKDNGKITWSTAQGSWFVMKEHIIMANGMKI
jgi:hypothetical protein